MLLDPFFFTTTRLLGDQVLYTHPDVHTTSKALVTRSDALVPSSFFFLLIGLPEERCFWSRVRDPYTTYSYPVYP